MGQPARQRLKSEKYSKNINKRGNVKMNDPRGQTPSIGPILLGFFLFVVAGSAILQIIKSAQGGSPLTGE